MSLPLRKVVQPILDANKLESYHAAISDQKFFRIVGECGKPLFTVTGIEFTRREPTVADIEFATELFQEFLLKHKVKLDTFMAAGAAFNKLTQPKNKNGIYTLGKDYQNRCSCTYQDTSIRVQVNNIENKISVLISTDKHIVPVKLLGYSANKPALDKAVILVNEYYDYYAAASALETARFALSSCEI